MLVRGIGGVILVLLGAVWIAQGTGSMSGSSMSGHGQYTLLGVIVALIGVFLLVPGLASPRPAGPRAQLTLRRSSARRSATRLGVGLFRHPTPSARSPLHRPFKPAGAPQDHHAPALQAFHPESGHGQFRRVLRSS